MVKIEKTTDLTSIVGSPTIISQFPSTEIEFMNFLRDIYFAKLEIISINELRKNGVTTLVFDAKKSNRDDLFTYNLKKCSKLIKESEME